MTTSRITIFRDLEQIELDVNFLDQISSKWHPLDEQIKAYPVPELLGLSGQFNSCVDTLRATLPAELFVRKFQTGEDETTDGRLTITLGEIARREFLKSQKELMYNQTKGVLYPGGIPVSKDAFMDIVEPKDPFQLLEAAHNWFWVIKDFPESATRCRKLIEFKDGELIVHQDAREAVEIYHSEFATDQQLIFLNAVQDHLGALRAAADKYNSWGALRAAIESNDPSDLRWVKLTGTGF